MSAVAKDGAKVAIARHVSVFDKVFLTTVLPGYQLDCSVPGMDACSSIIPGRETGHSPARIPPVPVFHVQLIVASTGPREYNSALVKYNNVC
jgi:hypothetical protein